MSTSQNAFPSFINLFAQCKLENFIGCHKSRTGFQERVVIRAILLQKPGAPKWTFKITF